MVKSAVWADLNGDKKAELIVTGEWMPVKVFEYAKGKMKNVSANFGFDKTNGWWNKIIAEPKNEKGSFNFSEEEINKLTMLADECEFNMDRLTEEIKASMTELKKKYEGEL